MSFKKKLEALRKLRGEKLASAMELNKSVDTDNRTFNEDEQKTFDTLTKSVESIDAQIKSTELLERLGGEQANPIEKSEDGPGDKDGEDDGDEEVAKKAAQGTALVLPGNGRGIRVHRNLPKGTAFTRYAMAVAQSKGNIPQAEMVAKTMWGDSTPEVARILRAAVAAGTTTDPVWAKPLVDYRNMTEEFVELLRPETILGKISARLRNVPFNVRVPRQTTGSTVGWVGEAAPKPVGKLGFDTITMPETKIAGIVVITQELARFSSPSAEALVRADMIEAIATFTDRAFVDPLLASVAGISPASITNAAGGATLVASTGSTLAEIENDLMAARLFFVNNNIPLATAVWIMNPATRMALAELRTAQDMLAFPGVDGGMTMGQNGMNMVAGTGLLKGIPIIESNSVGKFDPDAGGVLVAEFFIALVSVPNIMLADDGQVTLDASAEASISMTDDGAGTTLTSLWQRNMIGLRAERYIHWLSRRANSVYVITSAAY